jgi:hypothetical protein
MKALAAKKDAVVSVWLSRTLGTYPEQTARILARERDPFLNPVGHTFKEALPALFDELLGEMDAGRVAGLLDGVVRIRAVQEFKPSRAVGFIPLLRKIIREEFRGEIGLPADGDNLATVEERIDEMALIAFDLYAKCRERIWEIKANQSRSMAYVTERIRERSR